MEWLAYVRHPRGLRTSLPFWLPFCILESGPSKIIFLHFTLCVAAVGTIAVATPTTTGSEDLEEEV